MAAIKLYYFNFWGRGELCRLLLAASGCDWEDIRFSKDEWNNTDRYKPLAPFGKAPFLYCNGQYHGQSIAIANFLAREFGLAGGSSQETLRNDEVVQLVQDLMALLVSLYYEEDGTKKAELREKLLQTEVPRFCGIFDRLLAENGHTGHFVGTKLSQADLAAYDIITNTQLWLGADFEAAFPALKNLRHKVESNAHVKNYLDSEKARQTLA
ncbi:hematopoietic prostaglandin D synthase-like [Babylonia areolata]|uniref:hematopoietic prostaglandin D synthase-like n=1 Tax=Babylonia areolata TaxID=304850 RepID=UPI003FD4403D